MSPKTPGSDPVLSLVIPCFNEAENVGLLLKRLAELAPEIRYPFEVIFADGGSPDGTPGVIRDTAAKHGLDFVSVKELPPKGGYGHDIVTGLKSARAEVLAWSHADMQTDIKDVFDAYSVFQAERQKNLKILIKGKRQNRPFFDMLFTFGMQVFTWLTIGIYIDDINAQPKVFDRRFFTQHMLKDAPNDFSLDLFALIQARLNGYTIVTIPVVFAERVHGAAKGGGGGLRLKFKLAKRTVKYILETRKKVRA